MYGKLRSADRATRQSRAAALAARWNDRAFRTTTSQILAFADFRDEAQYARKLRAWLTALHSEVPCLVLDPPRTYPRRVLARNDVLQFIAAVEDLALSYNSGESDPRSVALTLGVNLIDILGPCLWLVWFMRGYYESPNIGYEWATMVRDLRTPWPRRPRIAHLPSDLNALRVGRWRRRPHPNLAELLATPRDYPIGTICLPPRPAKASTYEWALAARLAHALRDPGKRAALRRWLPRADVPDVHQGWQVIVVPRSVAELGDAPTVASDSDELIRRVSARSARGIEEIIERLGHHI